jgi:hypothetical protein
MALDNAEFISELSITDPPGTDPLNQGDDQIRTVKRATQQSFPNVDAPVPQTAAQMAQMAIKNEVNIFTQENTFSNILNSSGGFTNFRPASGGGGQVDLRLQDLTSITRWTVRQESDTLGNDFVLQRRDAAGVFIDTIMRVNEDDGIVTWDSVDNLFKQTATFQFVAQFNSRSLRFRATNASDDTGCLFISDIATLRWELTRQNSAASGDLRLLRYDSNGTFQSIPMQFDQSNGKMTIVEPHIVEIQNDRMQFRRSATTSPTARVGHSLRRFDNTKMWEIYADNNDDFHMNQRRTLAGAAAGTSIKILFASGHIVMAQLPTSAPATSKTLWMSSGFIAITP